MNPSDPRKPQPVSPSLPSARHIESRARRALIGLAVILPLLLLSLLTVGLSVVNVRGARAWRAYVKEAEARGAVLTVEKLMPPPVPDDHNFAKAPIFDDIFATNHDPDLSPFKLPIGFPSVTNRLIDLTALRDAMVAKGVLSSAGTNPVEDVRETLKRYDGAIEQLREAARRPQCCWPVDWKRGAAVSVPHASELLRAGRVLRLRVVVALERGDPASSLADLRLVDRLYHSMARDPCMAVALVRAQLLDYEIVGVSKGLIRHAWSMGDLQQLDALLSEASLVETCAFALRSERAAINDTIEGLLAGDEEFEKYIGLDAPRALRSYPSGWIRNDQLFMNQLFDEVLATIDSKNGYFHPAPSFDERIEAHSAPFTRWRYLLSPYFLAIIDKSRERFARTAAQVEFARTGIALERYRLAHGAFPEKLADLGETRADFARNPDGGGVLSYRRESDGGYLLWATGPLSGGTSTGPSDAGGREAAEWRWRMPGQAKSG